MADPATTITLVHGTFASDAPWTRPDSVLRTRWPRPPGRAVDFSIFKWSGDNSHEARLTAAADLARQLGTGPAAARRLIVAHSHGGNVALMALADGATVGRVEAVACLNTPFIHCDPRNVLPLTVALLACNPFVWLMLASPVVLERYVVPRFPGEFMKAVLVGAGLLLLALVPAGLAGVAVWRWSERVLAAIERRQRRRAEAFRVAAPAGVRVFAATVKRDEAYRYLSTLDRLTGITAFGMSLSQGLFFTGVGAYLVAGSGGFLTDFNWFPSLTRGAFLLSRLAAYLIAAALVGFVASTVVMTITGVLLRGHRYGYGEALGDSLLLNIRVAPYPPGSAASAVHVFEADSPGLQHSALYSSPALVQTLSEWFEGSSPTGG